MSKNVEHGITRHNAHPALRGILRRCPADIAILLLKWQGFTSFLENFSLIGDYAWTVRQSSAGTSH